LQKAAYPYPEVESRAPRGSGCTSPIRVNAYNGAGKGVPDGGPGVTPQRIDVIILYLVVDETGHRAGFDAFRLTGGMADDADHVVLLRIGSRDDTGAEGLAGIAG
jgi:hypothetical protein